MNKNNPKSRRKLAIILVVTPLALVIISFLAFAVINLIFNPTFWMTPDTTSVYATPLYITILNGVFFAICGVGLLSFMPCLIGGIYLFASHRTNN